MSQRWRRGPRTIGQVQSLACSSSPGSLGIALSASQYQQKGNSLAIKMVKNIWELPRLPCYLNRKVTVNHCIAILNKWKWMKWSKICEHRNSFRKKLHISKYGKPKTFLELKFLLRRDVSILRFIWPFHRWQWNNGQYDLIRCPLTANWGRLDS